VRRDNFLIIPCIALGIVVASFVGSSAIAYDTGPPADVSNQCARVNFSDFSPKPYSYDTNNTEVKPQSDFSFFASKEANPRSIVVTIKGEKVPITVKPQANGSLVTGKLPSHITGSFVRIEISAKGPSDCTRADGWLLKVGK
jgi:hypothetical protein